MYKYLFFNDYSEGAHPRILDALSKNNNTQEIGYGEDSFTKEAGDLLKKIINNPKADVHFVSAGTQANIIMLAAMLKSYESIIAPITGHINVHEAGAIEATGHKINLIDTRNGKITPESIEAVVAAHTDEHMVKPRVVFISQSTEIGTVYTKKELEQISKTCKKYGLYLYVDGARLGSALACAESGLDLSSVAELVDAFYIGGTKNGALFGEAIVIVNPELQNNFRYHLKQRGALLAKGRALGVQFLELFKDDLYFELARHANAMAKKLAKGFTEAGCTFLTDSVTNQIFPILPNNIIEKLNKIYGFYTWSKVDQEKSAVRLVTSWTTKEAAVDEFLSSLKEVTGAVK